MSVSPLSSIATPHANATPSAFGQRRAAFQALATALQSGDLAAARTAFAEFRPKEGSGRGPLSKELQALASPLQSGDLTGAQEAFAALRQAMRTIDGPRPHQRHHPLPWQQPGATLGDASTIYFEA